MRFNQGVIDNFLPEASFKAICDVVLDLSFPWHWAEKINDTDLTGCGYFIHDIIRFSESQSKHCDIFQEHFLKYLPDMGFPIWLRAVMHTSGDTLRENDPHIDFEYSHKGALLYLNDNDGFTRISENSIVNSVKNRLLLHDPSKTHNSTNCTNSRRRVLLVCNYH